MRIKILLMAVVLTGLLFSLSASAAITDPSCGSVPIQKTSYITSTEIPKFDSSLGELISVEVTAQACGFIVTELDSEDQIARDFTIFSTGQVTATLPNEGDVQVVFGTPVGGVLFQAAADDEPGDFNADWAGPDYIKIEIGSAEEPECSEEMTFIYDTDADMAPFIGNANEVITIPVEATSESDSIGSQNRELRGITHEGIDICVVYEYLLPLCINGTKTDACTGDGLPGWTIQLINAAGTVIDTDTTDDNGDYSFCDLVPGSYTVSEVQQAGWNPVGPTSIPVILEDESAEGVDFENGQPVCISGFKYNGTTDEGLSGWTIQLKDAAGTVIQTTTTGADGSYGFCDLAPGSYTVSEVTKSGWTAIGPTSISVTLECEDSEDNIFRNKITSPPPCGPGCPWFIKNELYIANCKEQLVVGADKGLLANEMFDDVVVLNPELITIDPKYGTLTVEEDGSFVYNPIGATGLRNGIYVQFKYGANNGLCDAKYLGIAKIQVACK